MLTRDSPAQCWASGFAQADWISQTRRRSLHLPSVHSNPVLLSSSHKKILLVHFDRRTMVKIYRYVAILLAAIPAATSSRSLQSTCSLGVLEDPVICQASLGNCGGKDIASCNLRCEDDSACQSSTLQESDVECQVVRSCASTTHRRNAVTCQANGQTCPNSSFFASAVECAGGSACFGSRFYTCSCCKESAFCPEGVPLCTATSGLTEFCSTLYLGQTCKDWGNPICDGVDVGPSPEPIHPAVTCSLNQDVVSCSEGPTDCSTQTIQNCAIDCNDSTCASVTIVDSTVECATSRSCSGSMTRSTVNCGESGTGACTVTFEASAITCKGGVSGWQSRYEGDCNCCDGLGCPDGLKSCLLDREELCSTPSNGSTCKELGNPICKDGPVTQSPTDPPVEATGSPTGKPTTSAVGVGVSNDDPPSMASKKASFRLATLAVWAILITIY